MRTTNWTLLFLFFMCVACKEQPLSYTISLDKGNGVTAEMWQQGEEDSFYTGIYVTDQYYVFSEYENDSVLKAFDKNDPLHCIGFNVKRESLNHSIDFVKSNTRYPSGNNDVWFVENKRELKQMRVEEDTLLPINTWKLPMGLTRSTNYNFTKDELYAVPVTGSRTNTFYFFQPDSGYYWVGMHGFTDKVKYRRNPYAFLSNLCVNEKQNAVVSAFLFFNQIQFFDLRGNLIRSAMLGDEQIAPINNGAGSLDYENSTKCFIDMCSTNRYVYCLYDGSKDFDKTSQIVVFKWNGTHVTTYHTDRILKNIAVDELNKQIVAISVNERGRRDVVRFPLIQ